MSLPTYLVLATRIRKELIEVERVLERGKRAIDTARRITQDQEFYLDSAALNLQASYTGLEKIFHQIGATVDGKIPSGRDWHRELLVQMSAPLADVRPAVLSDQTRQVLDEMLRFRHVVRNVYTFNLDLTRVSYLLEQVETRLPNIKQELYLFANFLESIGADE